MEPVQCTKCGFLALRDRHDRTLHETDEHSRDTGEVDHSRYELRPYCFVQAIRIDKEIIPDKAGEFLRVITRNRPCGETGDFFEWQQGFSPKEHREMKNERQMLEWQAAQEERRDRF